MTGVQTCALPICLSELPSCPWHLDRIAQTRGTRQASASVSLTEFSVSTPSPQTFLFQHWQQTPRPCYLLPGFLIWPSQRLGSCDPGISWLDMTVALDLDLGKRFGSGSQQASCSTRDSSLASVSSPSSPTRIGISGSLSRLGLEPPGRHCLTPCSPNRVTFAHLMPTRTDDPVKTTRS